MDRAKEKRLARQRRHARTRKGMQGTSERPRLSVYRSLKHIYAQVIDDTEGCTLVAASTQDGILLPIAIRLIFTICRPLMLS